MNTRRPTANPRHPTASADLANSNKLFSVPAPPATTIGSGELATTSAIRSTGEASTVLTISAPRSAAILTTWASSPGSAGSLIRGPHSHQRNTPPVTCRSDHTKIGQLRRFGVGANVDVDTNGLGAQPDRLFHVTN